MRKRQKRRVLSINKFKEVLTNWLNSDGQYSDRKERYEFKYKLFIECIEASIRLQSRRSGAKWKWVKTWDLTTRSTLNLTLRQIEDITGIDHTTVYEFFQRALSEGLVKLSMRIPVEGKRLHKDMIFYRLERVYEGLVASCKVRAQRFLKEVKEKKLHSASVPNTKRFINKLINIHSVNIKKYLCALDGDSIPKLNLPEDWGGCINLNNIDFRKKGNLKESRKASRENIQLTLENLIHSLA